MGKLATIPLEKIRENPIALRTVNTQSEDFLGLANSIKDKGFIGAISVRERTVKKEDGSSESYYELVDGLQRYSACKYIGLQDIQVDIVSLSDDEVLETQILTNIHKIETRPSEYSEQLRRILARHPLMTEAELATKVAKSTQWIGDRLSLNKIEDKHIKELINSGKIGLSNAYALAKLPVNEQGNWVDRAMTEDPGTFGPAVHTRVKEVRDANRQGKDAKPLEFQPTAHLRKPSEVKAELATPNAGKAYIKKLGLKTPEEAWAYAIKWILNLDDEAVSMAKARYEQRQAEVKAKQAERQAAKDKAAAEAKAQILTV